MKTYKKWAIEKLTYMPALPLAALLCTFAFTIVTVLCFTATLAFSHEHNQNQNLSNGDYSVAESHSSLALYKAQGVKRSLTYANNAATLYKGKLQRLSVSPVQTDQCLPLLKSVHLSSNPSHGPHQRPAGTAAALGLVLGVRYALLPHPEAARLQNPLLKSGELSPASPDEDNRSALTVAAWRQCQKELALHTLRTFRWQR